MSIPYEARPKALNVWQLRAGLRRLPQELADIIAGHVFAYDSSIPRTVRISGTHYRPPVQLQVNRHTRSSFAPLYYKNTSFLFPTMNVYHRWIRRSGIKSYFDTGDRAILLEESVFAYYADRNITPVPASVPFLSVYPNLVSLEPASYRLGVSWECSINPAADGTFELRGIDRERELKAEHEDRIHAELWATARVVQERLHLESIRAMSEKERIRRRNEKYRAAVAREEGARVAIMQRRQRTLQAASVDAEEEKRIADEEGECEAAWEEMRIAKAHGNTSEQGTALNGSEGAVQGSEIQNPWLNRKTTSSPIPLINRQTSSTCKAKHEERQPHTARRCAPPHLTSSVERNRKTPGGSGQLNTKEEAMARSIDVDSIPEKLRCAIGDRLAISAMKLPCCGSAVCGDCHDSMSATVCPLCFHTPFSADTCVPAKGLQMTIKAFMRTQQKKRYTSAVVSELKQLNESLTAVQPRPTSSAQQSMEMASKVFRRKPHDEAVRTKFEELEGRLEVINREHLRKQWEEFATASQNKQSSDQAASEQTARMCRKGTVDMQSEEEDQIQQICALLAKWKF